MTGPVFWEDDPELLLVDQEAAKPTFARLPSQSRRPLTSVRQQAVRESGVRALRQRAGKLTVVKKHDVPLLPRRQSVALLFLHETTLPIERLWTGTAIRLESMGAELVSRPTSQCNWSC